MACLGGVLWKIDRVRPLEESVFLHPAAILHEGADVGSIVPWFANDSGVTHGLALTACEPSSVPNQSIIAFIIQRKVPPVPNLVLSPFYDIGASVMRCVLVAADAI